MKAMNSLKRKKISRIRAWAERNSEQGTLSWLFRRSVLCILEMRIPVWLGIKALINAIYKTTIRWMLYMETSDYRYKSQLPALETKQKNLFAVPLGSYGKPYVSKIIERFGYDEFDYYIFVWDDTVLDEPIFEKCKVIREEGLKWYFMKKYLTPEVCSSYRYVFCWDDDLSVERFSHKHFIEVMETNGMEMAQPALTLDSYVSHGMTYQQNNKIGRYTDFVEVMAPVFHRDAWKKFWDIMVSDWNHWGWGYDVIARAACDFKNIGIIDCEPITHNKPCSHSKTPKEEENRFLAKYPDLRRASYVSYAGLR